MEISCFNLIKPTLVIKHAWEVCDSIKIFNDIHSNLHRLWWICIINVYEMDLTSQIE